MEEVWVGCRFNKIDIWSEPFKTDIDIEVSHVMMGYGINQARQAVKNEMKKYIEHLLGILTKPY